MRVFAMFIAGMLNASLGGSSLLSVEWTWGWLPKKYRWTKCGNSKFPQELAAPCISFGGFLNRNDLTTNWIGRIEPL